MQRIAFGEKASRRKKNKQARPRFHLKKRLAKKEPSGQQHLHPKASNSLGIVKFDHEEPNVSLLQTLLVSVLEPGKKASRRK